MGQTSSYPVVPPLLLLHHPPPEGDAEQENSISSLPDECLGFIFHKLSVDDRNSCSLVCKHWYSVESNNRDRLTLRAPSALHSDAACLLIRFQHVTNLSLKCSRKELSIDDKTLVLIGEHCKQLSRLKLRGCKAVTDDGLSEFAKVCSTLKKFSCGSCGFGGEGLNSVLQNCPKLEDLSVKRLRKLRDNPDAILAGQSKLCRLCLKEVMSAHRFETLISESKHLHTLVLARNPGLWDVFFDDISENLSELIELHVESLNMGDMALIAISRCSKLEVLHVTKASHCSDKGYCAIANGCRNLRKLHIDDRKTGRIGDEGLLAIGKLCTDVQELVLMGVHATARSLDLIASNCPGLERMALCNCDAVGDRELSSIADKCLSLKKLCIRSCPISDLGLEGFARGCPNLCKVKVKKCKGVTPASVIWLNMNRTTLIVSIDNSSSTPEEDEHDEVSLGGNAGFIRASTALVCSRSRLVLAASNFLRRLSMPS